jgi:hypothetical protein
MKLSWKANTIESRTFQNPLITGDSSLLINFFKVGTNSDI